MIGSIMFKTSTLMEHQLMRADRRLSEMELNQKYRMLGRSEHPCITYQMWCSSLQRRETFDNYWGWVSYQLELQAFD